MAAAALMSAFSILVIELPVPSASKATPVMAPVASMSQSDVSIAIVTELLDVIVIAST